MNFTRIGTACFLIGTGAFLRPAHADANVDFRKALAHSASDLRSGLRFDTAGLRKRIEAWEEEHHEFLYAKIRESTAGLPAGPRRTVAGRVIFSVPESEMEWILPAARSTVAGSPDIRWLCRTVLIQTAAVKMNQDLRMSAEKVSGWLEFFSLAEPAWTVNATTTDTILITADYGEQDSITFDFKYKRRFWRPTAMEWRQKLPAANTPNR